MFTVPLLHECITNMIHDMEKDIKLPLKKGDDRSTFREAPWKWFTMSDLGFPLVDDEYYRPMHPMLEAYISACLRDPDMLDDNKETGILCDDSLHSLPEQIKLMMSD